MSTGIEIETNPRGIARITLNRPDKSNSLTPEMLVELADAFATLGAHPAVRVILLRGQGKHFSAGAAIGSGDAEHGSMTFSELCHRIDHSPKPTIARIHGACIGGAVAITAACDIAVAASDAVFAIPEVRLGFVPGSLMPYFVRAIGLRHARRYTLSGERFDAGEAYRLGLVHQIASADGLDTSCDAIIDALLHGAPAAITSTKRLAAEIDGVPITTGLLARLEADHAAMFDSAEAVEGKASFRDKRKPNWYPV